MESSFHSLLQDSAELWIVNISQGCFCFLEQLLSKGVKNRPDEDHLVSAKEHQQQDGLNSSKGQ